MKVFRVCAVGGAAVLTLLGLSAPAFAHVTVAPEGPAAKGGYAVIDFKVPNERDNAATTKLEVTFPFNEHPLTSVAPQPVPGWTIKITKSRLAKPLKGEDGTIDAAVSKVTWTADGKGVEPGYFQKFPVSVGKLPEDADQLVFKALQTYSDKEVVRWIEEKQQGQEEPENPAPTLELTAAATEQGQSGAQATDSGNGNGNDNDNGSETAEKTTDTAADNGSGDSDTTARVLGIAGIVVGVLAVAFGVLSGRRRGSS